MVGFNSYIRAAFILLVPATIHCLESTTACAVPTDGVVSSNDLVQSTNNTSSLGSTFFIEISKGGGISISTSLAVLTMTTGKSMSLVDGVEVLCSGVMTQYANLSQSLAWGVIPLIQCDDEAMAGELLASLNSGNNPCTIMYSEDTQGCIIPTNNCNAAESQLGSVFTTLSGISAQSLLSLSVNTTVTGLIRPTVSSLGNTIGSSSGNSSNTTLAMGILYGVTGIVAAAFLFIIISGAIRVHKHPERYGLLPHTWDGQQGDFGSPSSGGTAKAKGLARAVLDSIPLVRYRVNHPGDGEGSSAEGMEKNGVHQHQHLQPNSQQSITDITEYDCGKEEKSAAFVKHETTSRSGSQGNDNNSEDDKMAITNGTEDDMCPICFEKLKDGDILRNLPCNHKFHALCVDSWLLNSSSLCPLCRVDLSIAANEEVSDQPPEENRDQVVVPPGYDVSTSIFNRFLDTWNAQLLPREARRAAMQRFHEEAELRRSLRARGDSTFLQQNQKRWARFVRHRKWLHARSTSGNENENETAQSNRARTVSCTTEDNNSERTTSSAGPIEIAEEQEGTQSTSVERTDDVGTQTRDRMEEGHDNH